MSWNYPLGLFDAYGVELEYMIVDAETLNVLPICDRLIQAVSGQLGGDAEPEGAAGHVGWSNELVMHVVELKCIGPEPRLEPMAAHFQRHVRLADAALAPFGGRLLPTAMHPWMDPAREMRLWPHDNGEIYAAFDRIFGCTGHGWSNLQSTHLNLPFRNDEEFGRLHAAIRLLLPALPALAASSPLLEGCLTGLADTRLETYRHNARRLPVISGQVVPEPIFTRQEYEEVLLASLYTAVRPHDPDGLLQHEWLNARGAIARFDRGAIEIRVLDIQERPEADLALCALISAAVRALCEGRWSAPSAQRAFAVAPLASIFMNCVRTGERTILEDADWLAAFGLPPTPRTAAEFWRKLATQLLPADSPWWPALRVVLERGTLSTRIREACGTSPSRADLRRIYGALADCLRDGRPFLPEEVATPRA